MYFQKFNNSGVVSFFFILTRVVTYRPSTLFFFGYIFEKFTLFAMSYALCDMYGTMPKENRIEGDYIWWEENRLRLRHTVQAGESVRAGILKFKLVKYVNKS